MVLFSAVDDIAEAWSFFLAASRILHPEECPIRSARFSPFSSRYSPRPLQYIFDTCYFISSFRAYTPSTVRRQLGLQRVKRSFLPPPPPPYPVDVFALLLRCDIKVDGTPFHVFSKSVLCAASKELAEELVSTIR